MNRSIAGRVAIGAVIGVVLGAPAAATAAYDESQNWVNAYGRTVEHFSTPDRSLGNVLGSALAIADTALLESDRIPDRGVQQLGAWPWNGDSRCGTYRTAGSHDGLRLEFLFTNRTGQRLKATLYAPPGAARMTDGGAIQVIRRPLPGVVYSGGVISAEPMYCWFAHGMAAAGYLAMTYDVSGQGKSDGSSTGDAPNDLRDALDFFTSSPSAPYARAGAGDHYRFNPLHALLDRTRIGDAGHSMGAGAVQEVGSHNGVVKAVSAHSDLGFGRLPAADAMLPVQGQGADYESFIFPPQPTPGADPQGKLAAFEELRKANPLRDLQEVVIESGTHLAWSHVTWAYSATWSELVAFHYALAWFDRYLMADARRDAQGRLGAGPSATQRLTMNLTVDAAGHGLSKKFRSAYTLADLRTRAHRGSKAKRTRARRAPAKRTRERPRFVCLDMVARTNCTQP